MTTANIMPAPAGSIVIAISSGGVSPGQGLIIGSQDDVVYAVSAVDGDHATICPGLVRALLAESAATAYPSPDEAGDAMIAGRVASLRKSRQALATAEKRVQLLDEQLAEAEKAHAVKVADALLTDGKVPAKPAALSAMQAGDAATASALDAIRWRIKIEEDQTMGAVDRELGRRIQARYEADGATAWAALRQIASGLAQLHLAVGKNLAGVFLTEIRDHLSDRPALLRQDRVSRIETIGAAIGRTYSIDAGHGTYAQQAAWPTHDDVKHIAKEIAA